MSKIEIKKVQSKSDLKKFVTFPWKIYKGDKNWVPPIIKEKLKLLDKNKSPFFDHGAAEEFLAYKDGELVGTIAAIRDDNFIKFQKSIFDLSFPRSKNLFKFIQPFVSLSGCNA